MASSDFKIIGFDFSTCSLFFSAYSLFIFQLESVLVDPIFIDHRLPCLQDTTSEDKS